MCITITIRIYIMINMQLELKIDKLIYWAQKYNFKRNYDCKN